MVASHGAQTLSTPGSILFFLTGPNKIAWSEVDLNKGCGGIEAIQ